MKKWLPLILLACAQFVMVLDSSVMNVSITQIVEDLDTTIEGVQLAITMYTLVMAATMLVGAKLGDIFGRRRIFFIGLVVYGTGSLTTALSPNLATLLFGWSLVEGLGAAMVMPAIAALAVSTYDGRERALAFGVIGGISGAAIAIGPVIGGWVTTYFSWRYVFIGEVVAILAMLPFRTRIVHVEPVEGARLDIRGAIVSAAGLATVVFAVLRSSTWGWVNPLDPPTVNGRDIEPLGFSPTFFVILIGMGILWLFARGLEKRRVAGDPTLVDLSMLEIPTMRSGLLTLLMQQLILLGTFFVLPVYLQVVLGLNAFDTGMEMLPLSIALLLFALAGPRMAARRSPRVTVWAGLVLIAIGALTLAGSIDATPEGSSFTIGLALLGAGAGLLMSQLGNVIMSSVGPERSNEAGGLQGTAQNLGASLGTALIGSVLIAGLTLGVTSNISENPTLPEEVKTAILERASDGVEIVADEDVEAAALEAGLPEEQATAVAEDYSDAQLQALKTSLFAVSLVSLIAFWPARRLPSTPG